MQEMVPYVRQRSFGDIDELTDEVRHWDLDFWQLDRGRCKCGFLQFGVDDVHVSEVWYGHAIVQKIGPPSDMYTFGVLANRSMRQIWRGQHVTGDDLVVFPAGREGSAVSPPGFHAFTFSLSASAISRVFDEGEMERTDDLYRTQEVIHCAPKVLGKLRKTLAGLSRSIDGQPAMLSDPSTVANMTRDLPGYFLATAATAFGSPFPATTRRREAALVRAGEYIAGHAMEDICMADLQRVAKVSPRTLEYAFVERFGLTPKAFIKAYRLNKVREELRRADSTAAEVNKIARRWGFWHMSALAADYCKQFGELPSQTLRSPVG